MVENYQGNRVAAVAKALGSEEKAQVDLRVKETENENNQQAILRLLDELADLADGSS